MTPCGDAAISITAAWNDWRSAQVRLADVRDPHWLRPLGSPQPLLHAYVSCADVAAGALSHVCDRTSAPHLIRVCVLKRRNAPAAYSGIAAMASGQPTEESGARSGFRVSPSSPPPARAW
jgi:hypothetical protein